jgi:heptosyltransferase-1
MRVLIARLGSMGDVLHALPAVAALRAAHPDIEIGWAIERRWTPLLVSDDAPLLGPRTAQRPLVDHVHVVNTHAWRKAMFSDETWSEVRNAVRDMRAQRYDLAIDFQGSIKSALTAHLAHAGSSIGFAQPREKPATMFYTHVVQPTGRHIIEQNLSLLTSPFPVCSSVPSVVNVFPSDPVIEKAVVEKLPVKGAFAVLNPGAGWPAKQWPAPRYGEVARALRDFGIFSLVNYGPGEEALAHEVEDASDGAARRIFCNLTELIALTRRASLFIGGDTGPMHLANALGVPVVALFGPTDPARNGPYHYPQSSIGNRRSIMFVVLRHPSSRTETSHLSTPDPGLLQISAPEVIAAVGTLLSRTPSADSREPQP